MLKDEIYSVLSDTMISGNETGKLVLTYLPVYFYKEYKILIYFFLLYFLQPFIKLNLDSSCLLRYCAWFLILDKLIPTDL